MQWIKYIRFNEHYISEIQDSNIVSFINNAVNFKDGGTTHIVIQNGDKSASLTPDTMTETEMKNICTNQLGMTEHQAEKLISNTKAI